MRPPQQPVTPELEPSVIKEASQAVNEILDESVKPKEMEQELDLERFVGF